MAEVYRFRSAKRLLAEHCGELEQQVIYFASPDELNDPMEGFRDIFWHGDQIVWTNLFKHYVYCLHQSYFSMQVFGDSITFEPAHIPIHGRWDDPPTPQMGELDSAVWDTVYEELRLCDLIDKIATASRQVRSPELLFYINLIHIKALPRIQRVHVERGLQASPEQSTSQIGPDNFPWDESKFFDSMPQADGIHENFSEIMFSISERMWTGLLLAHKYNLRNVNQGTLESNRQLLLFDFPAIYVGRLDELLWPQWYAACFSKSYHNSSLWANYGDGHKGICLIFESIDADNGRNLALSQVTGRSSSLGGKSTEPPVFRSMSFHDITYADRPNEIDFFRNLGMMSESVALKLWYTDASGNTSEYASHLTTDPDLNPWRQSHWRDFNLDLSLKTKDWAHEQECRLVLYSLLAPVLDERQRKLVYDFKSLKGVVFGIKTTDEDKLKVIEIIHRKCQENHVTGFKFFQAYYSPEDGDIRTQEIHLEFSPNDEG